ncbi:cobalt-precorrin-6A reductase [Falsihalocynthiibacter sp. BN13B15]|uniref:cobalt-precorrin-6A reductase n=1 Tax=Falsihalocynthiibacter sp. BN13B15 TaxID=3240871 RepID=UPI00350FED2F
MTKTLKILLLSGSGEARRLAEVLSRDQSVTVVSSLAGATRQPTVLPVSTRIGGFGGYAAQRDYILSEGFGAVIDATHPFAARISERTQEICREISMPYLHIRRPEWQAVAEDDWTIIDNPTEAKDHIPAGSVVFLATGRSTLASFENLSEMTLICRQIDPPDGPFPYKNGRYLVGKPPFSVEDEVALFRDLDVDVLVVKNAGGEPSRTKLDAARLLGLPVLMLRRPPMLSGDHVETVSEALLWIKNLQEVSV